MGWLIDADRANRHAAKGVDPSLQAAYREYHRRKGEPDPTAPEQWH